MLIVARTTALIISGLILFGLNPVPANAVNVECRPLDEAMIERRVDRILSVPGRDAQTEELSLLASDWKAHCPEARENASGAIVVSLGRLLDRRGSRLTAASLLVDVGPNLRHVRRAIRRALADEKRRDRAALRASFPVIPTTYRIASTSLRCLLNKIRVGTRDAVLCRFLVDRQ